MKVYFVYEGKDLAGTQVREVPEQYKLKIDIPASWMESACERLLQFFLKTYNSKHPEATLAAEDVEMKCGSIVLKEQDIIGKCVREYNDIFILHKPSKGPEDNHEGETLCTNYGCGKYYKEEENSESSCHYHSKPPVFHDLEKYWGCCPSKKAFDWESFQTIETCQTGRHSTENKPFTFPKEEIANRPLNESQMAAQAHGQSAPVDEERRTTGPREFEGAKDLHNAPQTIVDGKAKCRNYGCGKEFVVDENNDTACCFHKEGPVFWDTYKYWKCCPDKRCIEFDDFVKIPGCSTGPHKL